MNKFLLAIPALCDFITSTLQYIALNFIPGSVYQMMRGGTIITTFFFSICFLKTKVQKSQIAGSALAFVGVFIVGTSNMAFSSGSSGSSGAVTVFVFRDFKSQVTFLLLFPCCSMASSSYSSKSCYLSIILIH